MLSRFELLNNAFAARPLKPLGQSIILGRKERIELSTPGTTIQCSAN